MVSLRFGFVAAAALMLGACSLTLPVQGQVSESNETFSGTATGYSDGAGNLTIVMSQGARCSGAFVYVTRREGQGTFSCTDGRTGPFTFVSTGNRGTGTGMIGGQRMTFTFGRI
jgi:hypothetical protein